MDTVRSADVHRVRLDFLQHFLPVGEQGFLGQTPFFLHDFQTFRQNIHAGDDLHFGDGLVRFQVSLGNTAASDNGDSEFFPSEFLRRTFHLDRPAFQCCHSLLLLVDLFVKRG